MKRIIGYYDKDWKELNDIEQAHYVLLIQRKGKDKIYQLLLVRKE